MSIVLSIAVWLQTATTQFVGRHVAARVRRDERGQATAEYALVLLGAAAVAILVVGWAAKTDRIGHLLDSVFDTVTGKIN